MNTFYLYKSNKPTKKYFVEFENPQTSRLKRIYFGSAGMADFILSGGDEKKKARYISRHQARENWNNPFSGGFWARWILWNKPSFQSSINDTKQRFDIKIINRTRSKSTGGNIAIFNEKPSAYRSMKLSKLGLSKPINKRNSGALFDWSRERWQNLTALLTDKKFYDCGAKGKNQRELGLPSVCRPSIRVNEKTPILANKFSEKQIRKAIQKKKKGERIIWDEL